MTKQCVYCSSGEGLTKDHIISKCLIPEDFPKINLNTVSSCSVCNNSFSKDEEYFRSFLVQASTENSTLARDMLYSKIRRSIKRNPYFGKMLLENMEEVLVETSSGLLIPRTKVTILKEHWDRHFHVLDKFIKGLTYNEFNYLIDDPNLEIRHLYIKNKLNDDFINNVSKWVNHINGIHYYGVIEHQGKALWIQVFYDTVVFVSIVHDKLVIKEIEEKFKERA
ncbi:MAG: hypothetical protein GF365_05125 [Candidatus Buchananbacteria bacterium]|nr:hypothetical protein [Candidatus Buchananbacteria bacterium]